MLRAISKTRIIFSSLIKETGSVSEGIEKVKEELDEVQRKLLVLNKEKAITSSNDAALKSITENLLKVENALTRVRNKANNAIRSAAAEYVSLDFGTGKSHIAGQIFRPSADTISRGDEQRARRAIREILKERPQGATLDYILQRLKIDRELVVRLACPPPARQV